uniref:Uncharacterized protein n=1 Tax=Tanacetum cinerariifolium TaxID=118510 RepID=A0A6L2L7N5_TANCI|nr:hypothetical protein [Tanacetum cinerariifolium]
MDANKKIDLDNPLYPNESKIMANIIQNHPLRFTIVASLSDTAVLPKISRKAREKYHNLEDDAMVKNIFNSGYHKDGVRTKFPSWMITDEMKLTDHYRMYYVVFGVDVPMTQSQAIKSNQRMHRTTSAHRRSTRLTPPTPIPTTAEADDIILQDTIQLSLAGQKSRDKLEAMQNVQKVKEHLIAEEITKLVEGAENVENVEDDSSTLRQDDHKIFLVLEDEEIAEDDYELRRKEKGKPVEESRSTPSPTTERENLRFEISSQINDAISNHIRLQLQHDDLPIWLALKYKFERLHVATTPCRPSTIRPRYQDNLYNDAHPKGVIDAKRQKTSEHGNFVFGESLSGQDYESEPGPSTSGYEHQYHIDQMQNFLKNDIVWESKKEIIVAPHPQRHTLVVQSCQRDPKAHTPSLVKQDLLYLKKGSSGPEKIVTSLHKFPAVTFFDDDIKERTSRRELGHKHKFITEIFARRAKCHEPNSEGTGSAWKEYVNARVAGLFLLVLLEYPNGKGVVHATSRGLDMAPHWLGVGTAPLMSPRQDETSEPLLYARWMAGPYRCKDATRGCCSLVRMTMHEVVQEMVVGECHEPNSKGSGSAWKEYVNARVAGLFLLVLLEYPNGKGVVHATSRGLDMAPHWLGSQVGPRRTEAESFKLFSLKVLKSDDEAGFTSVSTSVGGGNQLEDEYSDFYGGYEDQVVDLHGALKEYHDFMLSMSGSGSAWKEYVNARVAGLFLLVLLEYPNGRTKPVNLFFTRDGWLVLIGVRTPRGVENGSIVSITESNYKNLNKNDIEDMYLLIVNYKVDEYAKTGLLWSLLVFIRSTVIWEHYEVQGVLYHL